VAPSVDTECDHPGVAALAALMMAARQGYRQGEDRITLVECGSGCSGRLRCGPAASS
jgi:hypothetical protein